MIEHTAFGSLSREARPTPELLLLGVTGVLATALAACQPRPNPGMLPEYEMLVASCYTKSILRFDPKDGRFLGELVRSGSGGLVCPEGDMLLGDDGYLYVTSFDPTRAVWERTGGDPPPPGELSITNDQVLRYDGKSGEFVDVFVPPSPELNGPHALAFGKDGTLLVGTRFTSNILRYDVKSRALKQALVKDGQHGVRDATSMAYGPDGKLYVASYGSGDIFRFDAQTGEFLNVFISGRTSGREHAHNIVFGPDSNLYVVYTSPDGRNSVVRYDGETGKFIDVFISGENPALGFPGDLAFSPDGRHVYVSADPDASVWRYDGRTGRFMDKVVPPGRGGLVGATSILFRPSPRE